MEWRRPGGAAASWISSAWLLAGVLEVLTGAALSRTDSAGAGPADRNHTRRPIGLVRFARFTGNWLGQSLAAPRGFSAKAFGSGSDALAGGPRVRTDAAARFLVKPIKCALCACGMQLVA